MIKKSLIIAVVAFAAGYLTDHFFQKSASDIQIVKSTEQDCAQPSRLVQTIQQEISQSQQTSSPNNLVPTPTESLPEKNPTARDTEIENSRDKSQLPVGSAPVVRRAADDAKKSDAITDDEIDAVIPAPFNNQLKGMHGYLRDKYKEFVATEQADDWDVKMKTHIEDAIYSNPYGKDLIVESLNCKMGLCELRLYETKNGAWSFIHSEMGLQSWWDIGASSSSGFVAQLNGKDITAYYVLMSKKGS